MSYQHKDGFGSLFRNRKKEKDTQPDMRGDCMIEGREMEIAGWTKKDKNGQKYLSLKIQDKREQQQEGMQQARQAVEGFESDDIPF